MVQEGELPSLGFGSAHDPRVESIAALGSGQSGAPASDPLSLCASPNKTKQTHLRGEAVWPRFRIAGWD